MNKGEDFDIRIGFQCRFDLVERDRRAPCVFDNHRFAATANDVFFHAATKDAINANQNLIAGLDQIGKTGFHTGRAGRGYRKGQRVFGLISIAQQGFNLVHQLDKLRVQMADNRARHGTKHARVNIGRPGAHQCFEIWIETIHCLPT